MNMIVVNLIIAIIDSAYHDEVESMQSNPDEGDEVIEYIKRACLRKRKTMFVLKFILHGTLIPKKFS